ncbi:hypothetical protein [Williamsia sp.]|uniref:hypothetical protein n=1 Tax=Williamsia sp. TaxID=1872085 RepID=UPI001A3087A4|nr:hypothetical protein [Williamsia sp.]MBJ7289189.1 hypothetical protein [Williamsia sp.]
MTRRRAKFALIAVAVVAIAIAAAVVWVRSDERTSGAQGPFLTAEDFPAGYKVTRLPNTAPSGIGGTTTPTECGAIVAEQAGRQLRSATVGVLATKDGAPTFAQSVITGGESVSDTDAVVRRCSSYRQQTDTESLESISSIVSTPAGCPGDVVVVRATTRLSAAAEQSDSTSVSAYVQGSNAVGVLTVSLDRPEEPIPDEFCRLASVVADGLE